MSAMALTKTGILTSFLCEFVHSNTIIQRELNKVNGLSTFLFSVVVMSWETRKHIHQQKHTLAEPCFCYILFITNHFADFADLSWTAVLARVPKHVRRTVPFLFFYREPFHPFSLLLKLFFTAFSLLNDSNIILDLGVFIRLYWQL